MTAEYVEIIIHGKENFPCRANSRVESVVKTIRDVYGLKQGGIRQAHGPIMLLDDLIAPGGSYEFVNFTEERGKIRI